MAFLALGLTLPALMLQDSWRYSFFALGKGAQAFLNDTIWAVTLIPTLVLLKASGHASVFWFVFAWGMGGAVGAAVGPLQARVMPRLFGGWRWIRQHRELGLRYMLEGTSNSASTQLRNYGVGIILGLAAVGYVQAATTLMGPFMVIFLGMGLVTLPEAARVLRRSPRHLTLFCLAVSVGLSLMAIAWTVALLVALPRGLGHLALGAIWRPTYPLVLPLAISILGGCMSAGAGAGLHALGAAKRSLRAMVQASALFLAAGLAGAVTDGAVGTMRGAAFAGCVGALMFWWQLRAALREHPSVPEGNWFWPGRNGRHRGIVASSADTETTAEAVSAEAAWASAGVAEPELAELELAELESAELESAAERPSGRRPVGGGAGRRRHGQRRDVREASRRRSGLRREGRRAERRPAEDEPAYEPAVGRVHIGLPMDETMPMRAILRRPPSDRRPADGASAERPVVASPQADRRPAEGRPAERPPSERLSSERLSSERPSSERPSSDRRPADGEPTARPPADGRPAEGRPAEGPSAAGSRPDWQPAEGMRPERPSEPRPADGGPADRPATGRPQPRWIPAESESADRPAAAGRPQPRWIPAESESADRPPVAGRPQPRWIPAEGGSADRPVVTRPQADGRPAEGHPADGRLRRRSGLRRLGRGPTGSPLRVCGPSGRPSRVRWTGAGGPACGRRAPSHAGSRLRVCGPRGRLRGGRPMTDRRRGGRSHAGSRLRTSR